MPGGRADGADQGSLSPNMGGDAGEMEGVRALGSEHSRSLIPRLHALSTYTAPISGETKGGLQKSKSGRGSGG